MAPLVREPITPHRWRPHKWAKVDVMVNLFGVVRQCSKCHLVEVCDVLTEQVWRGPHTMLKSGESDG